MAFLVFHRIAVPLELMGHVTLSIVGILKLDRWRLVVELEGVDIYRLNQIPLGIVGVLLHPAIGVVQLHRPVGIVIGIGISALVRVDHTGQIVDRIVEI